MLSIAYPTPSFRMQRREGREYIFDAIRRKWLLLTPEEWVRQNFVSYLLRSCRYPSALIALEKLIVVGELKKRFDILVYGRDHQPWMMVECKASSVPLDESVLHQLLRYHLALPAGILVITNGSESYAWEKKEGNLHELAELPHWPW